MNDEYMRGFGLGMMSGAALAMLVGLLVSGWFV